MPFANASGLTWFLGFPQGSVEPDGQPGSVHAAQLGTAGAPVMGMNPLVGHKVQRYWAEVRSSSPPLAGDCPRL